MKTRFNYPTRILFGQGVVEDLPAELARLGVTRPLIVTDRGLARTPIPARVAAILAKAGLESASFDAVDPNPTDASVEAGAAAFRAHGADSVVALGGGSPLDAAKAIQLRVHHHLPLEQYDDLLGGDALITGPIPPAIAIPTTSGTGSEVSRSAVITIAAVHRKVVLFAPQLMAAVALCDPELTYGLPARVTAETGLDALSHSLEAYLSTGYHPMADAIALAGIQRVGKWLRTAVKEPTHVQARQEMMLASTMGAVAFQKGLGVVHSLAHALGAVVGIGHGLANAILMPHVVRFNGEAVPERVVDIARALGAADLSVEGCARAIDAMLVDTGLPRTLSEAAGVNESHLAALVPKALADGCHGSNPRPCDAATMEHLLRAAM